MDKHAYQLGAMAALHDLGIVGDGQTKTAAGISAFRGLAELEPALKSGLGRMMARGKGMGMQVGQAAGKGMEHLKGLSPAQQMLLAAGGGAGIGGGAGAIAGGDLESALVGAGAGGTLGAGGVAGGYGLQRLLKAMGNRRADVMQAGSMQGGVESLIG